MLSFGTAGCNLSCKFCQNWDISKSRETDTLADEASPETIARAATALGCRSVAFTYNDPVIFMEYADDVAQACRAAGVRTVAVTAGYMCAAPRARILRAHRRGERRPEGLHGGLLPRVTAASSGSGARDARVPEARDDVWLELTTLLIPGMNDSDAELDRMTRWVVDRLGPDVPLHFSAFHPDYKMRDVPATPPATLARARRIAMANGVRYAYTGNVHDPDGGSTYCHGCGARVIERDWYTLGAWHLTDDGRCLACGTPCAGRFEDSPGTWGARRLPVRLADFEARDAGPSRGGRRVFYPADPDVSPRAGRDAARRPGTPADEPPPKALIVPHAGYVYSGPTAGVAYTRGSVCTAASISASCCSGPPTARGSTASP